MTMLKNNIVKFRKFYYGNPFIKLALLKAFQNREVVLMDKNENWKCIRGLSIRDITMLDYTFNFYNIFERNYNIYLSVAKYKYIPFFDMNLKFRSKQTSNFFKSAINYIDDYDLFMDFDIDKENDENDFIKLKQEVYNFAKNRKGFILTSGSGLQYIENGKNIFPSQEPKDIFKYMPDYILGEQTLNNLKYLCEGGLKLLTRFRKCEWSLNETQPVLKLNREKIPCFNYDKHSKYSERLNTVLKLIEVEK